jgi:3'-phosphoadenosine 5'-phosphosulfate (PAPS) 3'-phosphatase
VRPDDAVLGEEAGQTGRGGRRWIVDPIDATALFVASDNRWLVLVALQEGRVVAAWHLHGYPPLSVASTKAMRLRQPIASASPPAATTRGAPMGRGLSPLQQAILTIAYRNRQAEQRTQHTNDGADCYYHEVLAAYYGFELAVSRQWYQQYGRRHAPGTRFFSRAAIGSGRYGAAKAALYRAVRRLEERGLVNVWQGAAAHWTGVCLTRASPPPVGYRLPLPAPWRRGSR